MRGAAGAGARVACGVGRADRERRAASDEERRNASLCRYPAAARPAPAHRVVWGVALGMAAGLVGGRAVGRWAQALDPVLMRAALREAASQHMVVT